MIRLLNNLKYFLRYYGPSRAPGFVLPKLFPTLRGSQRFITWKESALDRKLGIRTLGNVEVAELDISSDARKHAGEYCPTSGFVLSVILEELGIKYSDYSFLDVGSGKGRAICLACEFPFAEIIGIELSTALCQVAEENIRQMPTGRQECQQIRIANVDATEFDFPMTPLVLYFFNPFDEVILKRVLKNVEDSSADMARDIVIIYSNPAHRHLLDMSTFWQTASLAGGPARDGWAVYRNQIV